MITATGNPSIDPQLVAAVEEACSRYAVRFVYPLVNLNLRDYHGNVALERRQTSPGAAKRAIRALLAERDGNVCAYCRTEFDGDKDRTLDHIIPFAMVRTWHPTALVNACEPCNTGKSDWVPALLVPLLLSLIHQTVQLNAAASANNRLPVLASTIRPAGPAQDGDL